MNDMGAEDLAKELLTQLIKVNNFFKENMPNETMIVKFGKTYIELLEPEDVEFIKENL
jgi:hypothetical protein